MNEKEQYQTNKKKKKNLIIVIILLVFIIVSIYYIMNISKSKKAISVGSKNFTEQLILGNLVSEIIEGHTNYSVDRKLAQGGTMPLFEGLKTGDVDLYVEYSGSLYLNMLKKPLNTITSSDIVLNTLRDELPVEFGITPFVELGFRNDYELTVQRKFADEKGIKTVNDLADIVDELTLAPSFEFINREDGLLGIEKAYGFSFSNVIPMEAGLRYSALESGEANILTTFSTDGMKYKLDLFTLEDTKNVFVEQKALILFNTKSLENYPEVAEAVKLLESMITEEEMMEMNYKVDMEQKRPEDVAKEFLREKGLL